MEWVTQATKKWCAKREHPFVTYHPHMDRSWCRCGEQQTAGDHVDMQVLLEGYGDRGSRKPQWFG